MPCIPPEALVVRVVERVALRNEADARPLVRGAPGLDVLLECVPLAVLSRDDPVALLGLRRRQVVEVLAACFTERREWAPSKSLSGQWTTVWASAAHLSDRVWAAADARVKVNGDHLHPSKCGRALAACQQSRHNLLRCALGGSGGVGANARAGACCSGRAPGGAARRSGLAGAQRTLTEARQAECRAAISICAYI